MTKYATFTSVWDGGYEITTNCKVDMETHEIFDIETVDDENVEVLDSEYVTIDGIDYPVSKNANNEDSSSDFWYEW